jgi:hypothetical protein
LHGSSCDQIDQYLISLTQRSMDRY